MTAPSVSGDPSGDFEGFASFGSQENDQKSPGLVLSGAERTQEALTAAAISLEFGRVVGAVDSRRAARYASQVVDNSRLLAAGNPRLHLNLLVSHRDWMRTLPSGGGLP